MRMTRINRENEGKLNEIIVGYDVYAPTYQEALVMLRNQLLSAALCIQALPLETTWDHLAKQKGPIALSRAAKFITARGLDFADVKKTVGSMSEAGKFDKMLPAVWQRQLLVDLLAGACKHVSPTYKTA